MSDFWRIIWFIIVTSLAVYFFGLPALGIVFLSYAIGAYDGFWIGAQKVTAAAAAKVQELFAGLEKMGENAPESE